MYKRTSILTLLALLLTAAVGFTASAQDERAAVGTGPLTAQGTGTIKIRGSAHIELSGSGVLKVKDCGGDLNITVTGDGYHVVRQTRRCVVHKYIGFNGHASITGRHIKVMARGVDLDLFAEGNGAALLKGRGVYQLDDQTGTWREGGVEVFLIQ
jgi:hypothetical protein